MLAPWKKSYDQPKKHIKKQRHYFVNKGPPSQCYGFSSSHVWIWVLDYKKAECQRIDTFELWCWRRLLKVPWAARRSNQSILKEISPEYSLEWLMLKLKLQYFGHLMQRTDSFERTLMLGKTEGRKEKGMTEDEMLGWHHWPNGHEFEQAPGVDDRQGILACCCPWGGKQSDMNEQLNWTDCVLCAKLFQLCPTLCVPMDYRLAAFSVVWILQVRILEWFDTASFRGSSRYRDPTLVYLCLLHWQAALSHQGHLVSPKVLILTDDKLFRENSLTIMSIA